MKIDDYRIDPATNKLESNDSIHNSLSTLLNYDLSLCISAEIKLIEIK